MTVRRFDLFACIDWSGAKGERQKGIAVAVGGAHDRPPDLIERRWSRPAVLDWLLDHADRQTSMLIGIDFSAAFPFVDSGAYFPGWSDSPADARALWRQVDAICTADPHLSATSFLAHAEARRYFFDGRTRGDRYGSANGRYRVVEQMCRDGGMGSATSCFKLVGASQVGKSSLTGMRMLHHLAGRVPIWPFDPVPERGPLIVEIYTAVAARAAGLSGGSKMRDADRLAVALAAFGIDSAPTLARYDDHSTDAILTAAWLARAASESALWNPARLTPTIAAIEGWTFGIP